MDGHHPHHIRAAHLGGPHPVRVLGPVHEPEEGAEALAVLGPLLRPLQQGGQVALAGGAAGQGPHVAGKARILQQPGDQGGEGEQGRLFLPKG